MKKETDIKSRTSVRRRIIEELKELVVITAYLYVCFAALIQLKAAILHAQGVPYATLGLAAVKAVICAKFMLLGSAFHVGERFSKPPLVLPTLYRSVAFLVLLIFLNVIEEAGVGVIHGRTIVDSISDIGGGTWSQIIATSFILFLVLIPFFAFRALGDVVGQKILLRLFFEPQKTGIE
jgi:hypothetical protein